VKSIIVLCYNINKLACLLTYLLTVNFLSTVKTFLLQQSYPDIIFDATQLMVLAMAVPLGHSEILFDYLID